MQKLNFVPQVDGIINIYIVDFQNIKNIHLRTAFKTVDSVASGNINSGLSPFLIYRHTGLSTRFLTGLTKRVD